MKGSAGAQHGARTMFLTKTLHIHTHQSPALLEETLQSPALAQASRTSPVSFSGFATVWAGQRPRGTVPSVLAAGDRLEPCGFDPLSRLVCGNMDQVCSSSLFPVPSPTFGQPRAAAQRPGTGGAVPPHTLACQHGHRDHWWRTALP